MTVLEYLLTLLDECYRQVDDMQIYFTYHHDNAMASKVISLLAQIKLIESIVNKYIDKSINLLEQKEDEKMTLSQAAIAALKKLTPETKDEFKRLYRLFILADVERLEKLNVPADYDAIVADYNFCSSELMTEIIMLGFSGETARLVWRHLRLDVVTELSQKEQEVN